MRLDGVVGVYEGVRESDQMPCLKVMVVKKTPELRRQIPPSVEGYAVELEESGEIRPLR